MSKMLTKGAAQRLAEDRAKNKINANDPEEIKQRQKQQAKRNTEHKKTSG